MVLSIVTRLLAKKKKNFSEFLGFCTKNEGLNHMVVDMNN